MNSPHRTPQAFTLIELLIVVAIIAILAAIAVPNFMEAHVRSKISRVKADMRACATAVEAYAVDNNRYPWDYYSPRGNDFDTWRQLTTPIAYITSLSFDIFNRKLSPQTPFDYGLQANRPTPIQRANYAAAEVRYVIISVGADRALNWNWTTFGDTGQNLLEQITAICYDPTNGTTSSGDIIRTSRGVAQ